MNHTVKRLYKRADKLGMKPFMFDQCIMQHDIFDRDGQKITRLNQRKYIEAAKTILKEHKHA